MGKVLEFLTMDLFKKDKKEGSVKVPRTPEQKINVKLAITRHMNRVTSLRNEFEILSAKLAGIETDETIHTSEKTKASDSIIRRLVHLKYEIEIREDLVTWLT